jgi:heme/copper-type cytochrome/quinol oxidase subunit 4
VFTGIDIIVIGLVLVIFMYVNAPPGGKAEITLEPLTLLVVIIVVSMIIVSFT